MLLAKNFNAPLFKWMKWMVIQPCPRTSVEADKYSRIIGCQWDTQTDADPDDRSDMRKTSKCFEQIIDWFISAHIKLHFLEKIFAHIFSYWLIIWKCPNFENYHCYSWYAPTYRLIGVAIVINTFFSSSRFPATFTRLTRHAINRKTLTH